MIAADDARHGAYAGYIAGCRCQPCTAANTAYHKRLIHDHHHDRRRTIPNVGFRRRIRALQAMGWPISYLATRIGWQRANVNLNLTRTRVNIKTDQAMRELYDELAMKEGGNANALRAARTYGYPGPLAWDDDTIDDPESKPRLDAEATDDVDHILVQRGVSGKPVNANPRERLEIIKRWQRQGWSLAELDRIQGWNAHRDLRLERAA